MSGALTEQRFRGPDGTEFAYIDVGSGPAIVLISGWSGSKRWYERNIAALAENHRVVAFDLRGHGGSDKTESGHTMDQYARDVHDVIEGLGVERPVIAGWSMGSIVLWSYILQFGRGQASGMVFVGQSASDLITPEYEHGIMTHDDLPEWIHAIQTDREPMLRSQMVQMVKDEPAASDVDWMTADYQKTPAHISSVALYSQTVHNSMPAFPKIDFPTQVYFGTDPKMYKLVHGEWLAEHIPGTELIVFEESGHVPQWEEADKFNDEIHRFTQRLADA
jgi:non-heme chloroperoxidase